jgi:hypothetical protein
MTTPKSLFNQKLASSGITPSQATKLGIKLLSATQTQAAHPDRQVNVPSMLIQYFDLDGRLREDICRFRLLEKPTGSFGSELDLRYLQPKNTPPGAYLPRIVPWKRIILEPKTTIILTEGELKAACAAQNGWACLGLGGVWSWRSRKLGWDFLPELEKIVWEGRLVVICYDSDLSTNPQVQTAIGALVHALRLRGAQPAVAFVPPVEGYAKTGLDDLVVARGPDALEQVIQEASPDNLSAHLWSMNHEVCLIHSPTMVYHESGRRHKPQDFRTIWNKHRCITPSSEVGLGNAWLQWPLRRDVHEITYLPGQPKYVTKGTNTLLNAWNGWGCESIKGDISPWLDLLKLLFHDARPCDRRWFEQWCYYPIQNPGVKMNSCVGIWSRGTGQGKSLVGVTLGKIYGSNYNEISQRELEDSFTDWAANRQFVMVDDVSAFDSRSKADVLKKFITQQMLQVNTKGVPKYSIPDCCNYYLTSNHPDAFYLEPNDRRYFVHEVTTDRSSASWYQTYFDWLINGGAEALRYYAEHYKGFAGFDPFGEPPMTPAKRDMIGLVRSDLEAWLAELQEQPATKLVVGQMALDRDIYTVQELYDIFTPQNRGRPVALSKFRKALHSLFPKAGETGRLRVEPRRGGKLERFLVVRNFAKWHGVSSKDLVKHILEGRRAEQGQETKY